MPGSRVSIEQRGEFADLLARGATAVEAGRRIGVSPATAYRLAKGAREKYRTIPCPSCNGTGKLLWRIPEVEAQD
jgi:hypothetical protein